MCTTEKQLSLFQMKGLERLLRDNLWRIMYFMTGLYINEWCVCVCVGTYSRTDLNQKTSCWLTLSKEG